ncbi:AMP-binding protein [Sinorhizobium meliloti]|nr:AMP-binding protein [Sinorhizobium meliloti]
MPGAGLSGAALHDCGRRTFGAGTRSPLHEHLSARNACLFVMYGQTEATARMAYYAAGPSPGQGRPDRHRHPGRQPDARGRRWKIISSADQPGELVYRGPNVIDGLRVVTRRSRAGGRVGRNCGPAIWP